MTAQLANVVPIRRYQGRTRPTKLHLSVRRHREAVLITAHGEVDATNAGRLGDVLFRFGKLRQGLIVDTSLLNFCGVMGVETLAALDRFYCFASCRWVLVPGPLVGRILPLVPDAGGVPCADCVDDAHRVLSDRRAYLRLVGARRRRR